MESLIIEKTAETPKIILDPANGLFEISERSLPENAVGFYEPVFRWLSKFSEKPNEKLSFKFNLEYYNTASAKQIAKLLLMLEALSLSAQCDVNVCWYYRKEDTDMLTSGKRYEKLLKVKFDFLEID